MSLCLCGSIISRETCTKNEKWLDSSVAEPQSVVVVLAIDIDIATRYRKSPIRSIAIANRDIDSEPVPYGNGCMKNVHKKQEMDG